ncbi:hypothetical protein F5880DRAFT_1493866, partial [Lentinula raphanica]
PFADADSRVVGLMVYPADPSIETCADEAAKLIGALRPQASFTSKQRRSRRGDFPQLSGGVAHGGGRLKPDNIIHNEKNQAVLDTLFESQPFQRLSGFATGVFKTWAPKLFDYCKDHFELLLGSDSTLVRIFQNSVLPVAAFNFGPRTVCLPHIDFGNLPFNWCWIWSLGHFNWQKGGHLILWDFGLVVEFPPGSLAAIPSGVCRHSNTRIGRREVRYSFTQYAPGGNFRWVDHGFQSEESYDASLSKEEARVESDCKRRHWAMGLDLFSTTEELGLCTS